VRDFIAGYFEKAGLSVTVNKPFSGAALVEKTADPAANRHSIQIEIARDLYMNAETLEYDEVKGAKMRDTLAGFAAALHDFAAARMRHAQPGARRPAP
jgi:N-formylglutamate amidohydrolase